MPQMPGVRGARGGKEDKDVMILTWIADGRAQG